MAYTTIDDPSAFFKVQLYTGDGSANHAITFDDTDTDMQPDLVWIKNRDAADSNCLFDAARGATQVLHTDTTGPDTTDTDTLDSFTSDGFQVDADVKVNTNTEKYVAWCWKAGTTSGITTDGNTTITPSAYSFNTTSGISIVKYTGNLTSGAKVAHGLGVAPKGVITKRLGSHASAEWNQIWNVSPLAQEDFIRFQTVDKITAVWGYNDTFPDSINFTLGDNAQTNSSDGMSAYCFAAKQGYSKFGSHIGNGNVDGTFVWTGFRPAMIMFHKISASGNSWGLFDNKRDAYNPAGTGLKPDDPDAEYTTTNSMDFLSNGFKLRSTDGDNNTSAATYIYMAWAEAPFVNSEGVPCNAR